MSLTHIVILAVIQGVTEFLPISSSGHLALAPVFLEWPDQGLTIDIAVHVGTLGAVLVYLWREIWMMLSGIFRLLAGRLNEGARLAGFVILASLPVMAAGYAVKTLIGDGLRTPAVIGWSFIGFGVLLYLADRLGLTVRRMPHLTWLQAVYIGCAQVFALIPGASRAGVTIAMARALGFERRDAARFSMLLSIPAIAGAGFLQGLDVVKSGDVELQATVIFAAALAFVAAILAIWAMMGWLQRQSYTPFVVYRILVGILILWLVA